MSKRRKAAKASRTKPRRTSFSAAFSATRTPKQRVKAMTQTPLAVCESDHNLDRVLGVVGNTSEPVDVRLAAINTLAAAAFSAVAFEPCRNAYIATLREVAEDPSAQIRESALGLLAGEKDPFAQKKLLDGLKTPSKALLPPEKALQLLGYDVHAESYAVARDIVKNPPNEMARQEALRLLAADASSAPLFEKLLRDKSELREVRQISASALHALNPKKLQSHARELVLDDSDYDDIRATGLAAVEQFGDAASVAGDSQLLKKVERMSTSMAPKYKKSAKAFLRKYAR